MGEAGGFVRSVEASARPTCSPTPPPAMYADEGLAPPTAPGLAFGSCVLQPESRGAVQIVAVAASTKPLIAHGYYAEEADVQAQLRGLRITMELARQPALAPYTEVLPTVADVDSDEDLRRHLRAQSFTLYHPVGTCALGSVVDAELRVNGLDGLRVIARPTCCGGASGRGQSPRPPEPPRAR